MSPEKAVGVGLVLLVIGGGLIVFAATVAPELGTGRFGGLLFATAAAGAAVLVAGIVQGLRETYLNRRSADVDESSGAGSESSSEGRE